MEELNKIEIGHRLREFALKRFGRIKDLSDYLGMAQGGFTDTYLNGRSLPGAKIISKLIKLGCDIDWLLHGTQKNNAISEKTENSWSLQIEVKKLQEENQELKEKLINIENLIKK